MTGKKIDAGHYQHSYTGMGSALRSIYASGGVSGLFSGSSVNVLRSMVGTPTNLTIYTVMREAALRRGIPDNSGTDMICSLTSSLGTAVAMNPVDVVR